MLKKVFTKVNSLVYMLILLIITSDLTGKRLINHNDTDVVVMISDIVVIVINLSIAFLIWYVFFPGIRKQAKKGILNQKRFNKVFIYTSTLSIVAIVNYLIVLVVYWRSIVAKYTGMGLIMMKKYVVTNYKKIILNLIWINFVLFIIAYLINNYVNYSIDYVAFHQGGNAMLIFLGIVDYVKWSRQKNWLNERSITSVKKIFTFKLQNVAQFVH